MPDDKSLVLIDDSNLYYGFKNRAWKIEYSNFFIYLYSNFNILKIHFFGGIISKKAYLDSNIDKNNTDFLIVKNKRRGFFKYLKKIGYRVHSKPVSSFFDNTKGEYKRKCNFDIEITITALDRISDYQNLILCSGDGDFVKLAKYIKGRGNKITVIAHKDRMNGELRQVANEVIFFKDIKDHIKI